MMDIIERIRAEMFDAMKTKDQIKKEVLQVVLGEVELVQSRTGTKPTDDVIFQIVRKLVSSNNETRKQHEKLGNVLQAVELQVENEILEDYLPKQLSVEEMSDCDSIFTLLEDEEQNPSKNTGKLIGKIISTVKSLGYYADGKDVKQLIDQYFTNRGINR